MTIKKIGFCCKWIDRPEQVNGIKLTDDCKKYNTGGTTVAWLNRQKKDQAVAKLWEVTKSNIESCRLLVNKVSTLQPELRMVRLSSDILPVYTHQDWSWFYQQSDVRTYCEREFIKIGNIARANNVRLSFHPGQFCCIVSDNVDVVSRSLEELEYHADMFRWLGYGKSFQDFKCNVHLSGRLGVDGFDAAWQQMSPELRNCLTLENDEYQTTVSELIKLKDKVAIVLDLHHHWINSGEYIENNSDHVQKIIDSWRGVRPVLHYSVSREDVLPQHNNTKPDLKTLIESGYKKGKLRAHSNFYWNNAVNEWALSFSDNFDIMCESKSKNLGVQKLYEFWKIKNSSCGLS